MLKQTFVIVSVVVLAELVSGQNLAMCTGRPPCMCQNIQFSCCLRVEENSPVGTPVGSASISSALQDAAGQTNGQYVIQQDDFEIDADSGNITTTSIIDRESVECYDVLVNVEYDDGGGTGFESGRIAIEIIDTNDNPPVFSFNRTEISIPETTNETRTIDCNTDTLTTELNRLMATDADAGQNAEISYSIQGSSILSIPDPGTTLCIQNSEILDRDDANYRPYEFTLVATDNGNPPKNASVTVILSLEGVNEFTPVFPRLNASNTFEIPETSLPGSVIHQFLATDDDIFDSPQEIVYEIKSRLPDGNLPEFFPFMIDRFSGELNLTEMVDADKAALTFEFTVRASDGEKWGTVDVSIAITDVNEPATITVMPLGNVTEKMTTTDLIALVVVVDNDRVHNKNSLEIISGAEYFEAVLAGRNFLIRQNQSVDREEVNPIPVTVRLIEGGEPMFINQIRTFFVYVMDVNDNPPTLSIDSFNYTESTDGFERILTIADYVEDLDEGENAQVGSITLVSAIDSKGVDITEEFLEYQDDNYEERGTLRAPPIDREVVGDVITIRVNITDSGSPPLFSTESFPLRVLDINDNSPVFTQRMYSFSIPENKVEGTRVGLVLANDPDKGDNGSVAYQLERPNSDYFSINEETGEITSKISFDREQTNNFSIRVIAMDKGIPPNTATLMANIFIKVADENDNSPIFITRDGSAFNMNTDDPEGTLIGTVRAEDADEGENARIEFKLEPIVDNFNIDEMGQIALREVILIETSFNLTVIARNPGSNRTARLSVTITVTAPLLSAMERIVVGCVGGVVFIILILLFFLLCCYYCYRKRRGDYDLTDAKTHLNNHPERSNSIAKPILKSVPAATANGTINRDRIQVSFSTRVDETHYKPEGAVTDNKVLRKASITNFGSSDESPQVPCRDSPVHNHNGVMPSMPVLDYENSPGEHMNGLTNDIPVLHRGYEMHHLQHDHSIHLRRDMTDNAEFSQGTSSTTDVNDSNSEEEGSTFSDGASNMNTSIPCFPKDEQDLHRFGAPLPPHPPHYAHTHSSHIPSPNLLGIIHPGNMSSLAAPEGSYRSSQGNGFARHSQNHSQSDSSSQTTTPSPHPRHQLMARMEPSSIRPIHSHTNGHNYSSHQLVMPDAYPGAVLPPDMHRHLHDRYPSSYSDYGETSTYASIELDEALHCDYDQEPGFYSLTATDYDDHEDR